MSTSLNNILDITRDMLYAAENGEWDQLRMLENSRSSMLSSLSIDIAATEHPKAVLINEIESILDLDRRIINLCTTESTSCKLQIRDFKKGRRAIASYHQFLG